MADYDVGAVSLSVPPLSAVLQQYRPAVLVKNNGVHDALAVGSLRIYDSATGLLIFTTEIYSGTIAPGETEPAQAVDYWTPPSLGKYQVIAYVTCINDQYEPNNSLAPRFVDVTGAPPPPEPTVQLHAAQHEEGGSDELNADGLRGKLADAQTALAHKTSHQVAGADALDLTGLGGILRDGQPLADHHPTHENGGGDEISVNGLGGVLVNLQPPQIHDNSKHDPNYAAIPHNNSAHDPDYATETALANHLADTTDVHAVATNLEQTANKGEPDGYLALDNAGHAAKSQLATIPDPIPNAGDALTFGSGWSQANALPHTYKHEHNGDDELSVQDLSGKLADPQDPVGHHTSHEPGGEDQINISGFFLTSKGGTLTVNAGDPPSDIALLNVTVPFLHQNQSVRLDAHGQITTPDNPGNTFGFYLKLGNTYVAQIATTLEPGHTYVIEIAGVIHASSATDYAGTLTVHVLRDDGVLLYFLEPTTAPFLIPNTDTWIKLIFDLGASPVGTKFDRYSYYARTEAPPLT